MPVPSCKKSVLRAWVMLGAGLLCACGDNTTVYHRPAQAAFSLPAALATGCVYPSTSAQTVPLPSAGGVSGTISVGAFASASATCLAVVLATGGDATLAPQQPAALRRAPLSSTLSAPLIQVQLTNSYTGAATWAGLQLQVPAGFPPGDYPATFTTSGSEVVTQTVNLTVTVNAQGMATFTGPVFSTGVTLDQSVLGLVSIYPAGTVLPAPTPAPTPSTTATPSATPSATPTASPSPTPSPTPTPSPAPSPSPSPSPSTLPSGTPSPVPTPTPTGTPTYTVTILPAGCQDAGSGGGAFQYTASATGPLPNGVSGFGYGWFFNTFYSTGWSIAVPNEGSAGSGTQIIGSGNSATVTYPTFPPTGLTGEEATVEVELYLNYGGQFEPITVPPGIVTPVYNSDYAVIAAGQVTCAVLGLGQRRRH